VGSKAVPDDLEERKTLALKGIRTPNRPNRDLLATPTEPRRPASVSIRVRHPGIIIIIIIHFA